MWIQTFFQRDRTDACQETFGIHGSTGVIFQHLISAYVGSLCRISRYQLFGVGIIHPVTGCGCIGHLDRFKFWCPDAGSGGLVRCGSQSGSKIIASGSAASGGSAQPHSVLVHRVTSGCRYADLLACLYAIGIRDIGIGLQDVSHADSIGLSQLTDSVSGLYSIHRGVVVSGIGLHCVLARNFARVSLTAQGPGIFCRIGLRCYACGHITGARGHARHFTGVGGSRCYWIGSLRCASLCAGLCQLLCTISESGSSTTFGYDTRKFFTFERGIYALCEAHDGRKASTARGQTGQRDHGSLDGSLCHRVTIGKITIGLHFAHHVRTHELTQFACLVVVPGIESAHRLSALNGFHDTVQSLGHVLGQVGCFSDQGAIFARCSHALFGLLEYLLYLLRCQGILAQLLTYLAPLFEQRFLAHAFK